MTIPFYDPRGRPKLPNYTYRTPSEQFSKLKKFLKDVENFSYIYETENETAGKKYLEDKKEEVDFDYLKENATEKMEALFDIAEEELIPEDVLDLLYEAADPVPGAGIEENSFLLVPVKEIKTDLHGFQGKINTVNYNDVYNKLKDGLSDEQIEEAHDSIDGGIMNDTLYQEPRKDSWQAVVDEDKFKDLLKTKLQMDEETLVERSPAVARLVKALAKLVEAKPKAKVKDEEWFYFMGLEFDVAKGLKLAKKYKPHPVDPDKSWNNWIDLNEEHIPKVDVTKPLLLATVIFDGEKGNMFIDGHHRVAKALQDDPNPKMEAITLDFADTMKIMKGPIKRKMMKQGRELGLEAPRGGG